MSGRPGRSGRKPTAGAAQVVPLYRQDVSPAEIVRRTGLSRSRVSQILIAAGLDPKARAAAALRERERQVWPLWKAGLECGRIARKLGLTERQVRVSLENLRRRGKLVGPRKSPPRPKTDAVEALQRNGLTVGEVVAHKVAAPNYVLIVRRRMAERGELDYRVVSRTIGAAQATLRARVAQLAKKGFNRRGIAGRLGVTPAQVAYCMVRLRAVGWPLKAATDVAAR